MPAAWLLAALGGWLLTHSLPATAQETSAAPPAQTVRPLQNPAPRSRTIPELVCTGEQKQEIDHGNLQNSLISEPFRLRLRGNMVYTGQSASSEQFLSLISRTDQRRWTAGTATLLLDDALVQGVWIEVETERTRLRTLTCEAFDTSRR
jgi:hypothetical protein